MAKAPVAGRAKTRLGRDIGVDAAARLAAAALLDPLDACTRGFGVDRCHLALDGDLCSAFDRDLIGKALTGWSVSEQRGDSFAARLVDAHADLAAAAPGHVVQIGMDTPQVTAEHLAAVVVALGDGAAAARADAVLGPALDGGWWVLALRDPADAAPLSGVAMSTPTTCADTWKALTNTGLRVVATTRATGGSRALVATAVNAEGSGPMLGLCVGVAVTRLLRR